MGRGGQNEIYISVAVKVEISVPPLMNHPSPHGLHHRIRARTFTL